MAVVSLAPAPALQMQLVYSDNANGSHPALLKVFIPAEMVRINKMKLTYQFEPFRAYSQATEGGGGRSVTTPSGGGSTSSSRAGAGEAKKMNVRG